MDLSFFVSEVCEKLYVLYCFQIIGDEKTEKRKT